VPGSACTECVNAPSTFATKASATLWLAKQRTLIAEGRLTKSTRVLCVRHLNRALMPEWNGSKLTEIAPAQVRA